ncbi:MAG: hypothetical protein ABI378_09775 [Chitinophagaceae bacterium]
MNKMIMLGIAVFTLASCQKTNTQPDLPPITQNGANTFGCLINGEPAYTYLYSNQLAGEGVEFEDLSLNYSNLNIWAITRNNGIRRDFYFSIKTPPPPQLMTYPANIISNDFREYGCSANDGKTIYTTDSLLPATIAFTKFTGDYKVGNIPGNILSGTFDMIMHNDKGDTIHLTNGRFDIKYQ